MNSGFNPVVVAPSAFRVQRASQQIPFHFGASSVAPMMMRGGGIGSSKGTVKQEILKLIMSKGMEEGIPHRTLVELQGLMRREIADMDSSELQEAFSHLQTTSVKRLLNDLVKKPKM